MTKYTEKFMKHVGSQKIHDIDTLTIEDDMLPEGTEVPEPTNSGPTVLPKDITVMDSWPIQGYKPTPIHVHAKQVIDKRLTGGLSKVDGPFVYVYDKTKKIMVKKRTN